MINRVFIEEATVTAWGMWMGRHLEMTTPTRGVRRILIFERTWDWGGAVELDDARQKAITALAAMGRKPAGDGGWWRDIIADDRGVQLRHPATAETWARLDDVQEASIPHLYAVLDLIPGFTGSWKDDYDPWADDDSDCDYDHEEEC